MPREKKTLKYKNKTYKYNTQKELSKKLKLSLFTTRKLLKTKEKYIVDKKGNIGRIKLDNPLLLQKFNNIKRTSNNKLISAEPYKIKGNVIYDELPTDQKFNIAVKVQFRDNYLIKKPRIRTFNIQSDINNMSENIKKRVIAYYRDFEKTRPIEELETDYQVISKYTNQTFKLENNKLRDVKPLRLFYKNIDTTQYKDCVRDYLCKKWKKMGKKTLSNLGDKNGVSTKEIYELCKKYNIKMIAWDINSKIIMKNTPQKKNKKYANLFFIAHNNHLYPVKNQYLEKLKPKTEKIELVEDADEKLKEFINKNIEPVNVCTNNTKDLKKVVRCFDVDNITYLESDEYTKCYEILKAFGIEETITKNISLSNITNYIQNLYCYRDIELKEDDESENDESNESLFTDDEVLEKWKERMEQNKKNSERININSFFPQCDKFIKGGYGYNKYDEDDIYENVKTIDKNKCYSYSLSKLPFLITLDIRKAKIQKYEKTDKIEIIDHYLYIVNVDESSILLPDSNVYSGYHLKYCKEQGLKFDIKESISTIDEENYFTNMIEDIYKKCNNEDAKLMLNIMIGKFEQYEQKKTKFVFDRIATEDECNSVDGFKIPIEGTPYNIVQNEEEYYSLFNQKPISIQVKDYSRVVIYEKMKELKINPKNIIKINTDSITFEDDKNICDDLEFGLELDGWKSEEPKLSNYHINLTNNTDLTFDLENKFKKQKSEYYNCYAGSGKTYYIINELIPKLKDYIILTPSHSTLKEYKKKNYNAKVIQSYSFRNTIPTEKRIVIDEFGLFDRNANNILHKCFLAGKDIYAFGDFRQLKPVNDECYDNKTYLTSTFLEHKQLTINRRNHFTTQYYDNLIYGKCDNIKEVKKHHTKDYTKADVIICKKNETVNKYNDLMLKHLNFKDKLQVGVKLICKTNKFRDKDIFNDFEFTIIKTTKDKITLDDNTEFDIKDIKTHFKPAYARTSYGVQGKSYKSFHYALEDMYSLKYDNRLTYTVISRLKTK